MKHVFLINHNIVKDAMLLADEILMGCQCLGYQDYTVVIVDSNEEMVECAQKCCNSNYIVYAVGDDQEVNFVLNGIVEGKAKLGVIPIGENNDFYRSLDEYQSDTVNSNIMEVNGVYALNNFNIGMNAEIHANMEKLRKLRLPSNILYVLSLMYTTFKIKGQVMGINDFWEKNILLSVANGTYIGGGYPISPRANIHRPEVAITTLNSDVPRSQIPRFWLDMLDHKLQSNSYASFYISDKNKEIVVETKDMTDGELDGILVQSKEFRIISHVKNIEVVNNRRLIRELSRKK